jgi:cysteine-rich repeat protein
VDLGETCDPPGEPAGEPNECREDCTYCGDGVLDSGEECDDGNNMDGDGCDAMCMIEEMGGEGCTPGYWKQEHHFGNWVGYSPTDVFDDVFGVEALGDATLLDALWARGGGLYALARHATAALLNTANSEVDYMYTEAEVIALVQEAVASGEYNWAKDQLAYANEEGCPLGRAELSATSSSTRTTERLGRGK